MSSSSSFSTFESDTPSYGTPSDIAVPTGPSGGIVAVVLGSIVGAVLLGGTLAAGFYGSRVRPGRYDGDGMSLNERLRLRREARIELERQQQGGMEKPSLVEVLVTQEEKREEELGEWFEEKDLVPLSLTLLPPPTKESNQPSTPTRALVSFLIRLPSSPRSSLDVQPSATSSASCDSEEEEDELEIVFGSDLVLVEGEEEERRGLLLKSLKEEEEGE